MSLTVVRLCLLKVGPKSLEKPDKPFIHDVKPSRAKALWEFRSPIARRSKRAMVEPDGIEPTTSCLQSTRSTN
jgi:hypothetical protein